jgi:hypothetical protein
VPEGELQCRFVIDPEAMTVSVTAPTRDGTPPARDSFAWMVRWRATWMRRSPPTST